MKVHRLRGEAIPESLRSIPSPPQELYVRGDLKPLLKRPRLSIVGSRKPTAYGRQVTEQLTRELSGQGIVIVSGLALGIDSIAHRACLATSGQTIAVLPSSLEEIYPASHRQLADHILEQGGALLSEYPVGTATYKQNFIARNRLVAGLADAILIVEAATGSGTLHTATFGSEQGRTIMAVPGNITSPLSVATNRLIKSCAVAVTEAADVLLALGLTPAAASERQVLAVNAEEAVLITLLQQGITDGAQLLGTSNLEPSLFNQTLTMLEISGKIRPLGAGHWALS